MKPKYNNLKQNTYIWAIPIKKNMKKLLILLSALTLSAGQLFADVNVVFYTPSIVRVQKTRGHDQFPRTESFAVNVKDIRGNADISVVNGRDETICKSAMLYVSIKPNGTVSFHKLNGSKILEEGDWKMTMRTEGLDAGAYVAKQSWILDQGEAVYGLGILQDGELSLRGKSRYMLQGNTEDFVPFIHSVKGYGIYWDNPSPTNFADDETGLSFESEVADQIDYYFIYGGDADGVISGMRWLTGQVPMIPLWGYGFMQSRERYKSSRELLDVLHGYRERSIPIDCVIQDWQYWGDNYHWNAMEFLNPAFSDAQGMIDEVHANNAHMMISIWASFGPQTKAFKELEEKGHLLHFSTWPQSGLSDWPPRMDYPSGVLPYDAFSKEARDIYWKNLLRLERMGIDGWWMDSTEPDHLDFKDSDLEQMTAKGSYRSVLNAFPIESVSGVVDKQLVTSDRRPMILTRSAFAGQQRTGANTWSGDVQSTWDDFRHQIPAGLGFTLTGNPNFNSDLGGFFPSGYNKRGETATCSRNPLFQELYVRWLEYGTFTPMMRSHGESSRREIWEFGNPGEPVYDAIAKFIKLRYTLLPYIYGTAWKVTSAGDSFMRALFMDFSGDRKVWNMGNEYMFGRSLLVAPVNRALFTEETRHWSEETVDWSAKKTFGVYLPAGSVWYDWWTGERFEGGRNVMADASLDTCPLYAKAGAIIPLGPDVQYSNEKPWDNLEIRVYLGADGEFTLYEDEFDGQNYKKGEYTTIPFVLKGKTLTIGKRSGGYNGMIKNRVFRVTFIGNGAPRTVEVSYSGKQVKISA